MRRTWGVKPSKENQAIIGFLNSRGAQSAGVSRYYSNNIGDLVSASQMGLFVTKEELAATNKIDAEINGLPYNNGDIEAQQCWSQLKQVGVSKGVRALSQLEMFHSRGIVSSRAWGLIGFWTWTGNNSLPRSRRATHQELLEINSTPSPSFFPQITNALNNNTAASAAWSALQAEGNSISQANWENCGIYALAGLYSMQVGGNLSTAIIDDINDWIQSN